MEFPCDAFTKQHAIMVAINKALITAFVVII